MIGLSVKDEDLAAFVKSASAAGREGTLKAPKRAAANASAQLKKEINGRFGRVSYWSAQPFAKTIRFQAIAPGWWRTSSKAVYYKGRSEPVDLLWFYDQPQKTITSTRGTGLAIPLPTTPLVRRGNRYAWPAELVAQGWKLAFLKTRNPNVQLIVGKLGSGPEQPLFLWVKQTRPKARLDVNAIFQIHADSLETLWAQYMDEALDGKKRTFSR